MSRNHEISKSVADLIRENDQFRACSQRDVSLNNSTSIVKAESVDRETPSPKLCSFVKSQENANVVFNWSQTQNVKQNDFNYSTSNQDLINVFNKFILNMSPSIGEVDEINGTEKSFFAHQLYCPKSASTPVQKIDKNTKTLQCNVGAQTNTDITPKVRKFKTKHNRLHSKSLPSRIFFENIIPDTSIQNITIYTEIVARDENYWWPFLLRLYDKIFDFYSWFKITIKRGVDLIYEFYTSENRQNRLNIINDTLNNLHKEILNLKEEQQKSRRELYQLRDIRKELHEIKNLISQASILAPQLPTAPPPPPPPLPPLPSASSKNTIDRTENPSIKKVVLNENARPVISLTDILNVKLRKTKDNPTPVRRLTEPLISFSLKKMKTKPTSVSRSHSSTSPASATNLSSSPISTLTRMLTAVDSNVRRVKRLQRQGAHSFDHCSRRTASRRERES